jgi:UPF0755 protein
MEDIFPNPFRGLMQLLGITLLVGVLGAALYLFDFWTFLHLPGQSSRTLRQVLIRPGMGAAAIAQSLKDVGIVADARKFYWLCLVKGAGGKLRAGEYAFLPLATPSQVLDRLIRGDVIRRHVTFPEGSTVRAVAQILVEAGLASEYRILLLAADESFIRTQGIVAKSLEGYLFPETYNFQRTQDEAALLETMLKEFRNRFSLVWQERARDLGFSVHEIVTLASLVEKEARVDAERPVIAAVFHNRLKHRMPLQSDPTAVYDLPEFSGPVTHEHLQRTSAYNTYQISGLPPGPICNPGAKSIQAALYPAEVPYVYFVSKADGTHQFSTTLAEHNSAVRNYRRKLQEQNQKGAHSGPEAPPTAESPKVEPSVHGRDPSSIRAPQVGLPSGENAATGRP